MQEKVRRRTKGQGKSSDCVETVGWRGQALGWLGQANKSQLWWSEGGGVRSFGQGTYLAA